KGMKVSDWKKCFASGFSCHAEKKKLAEYMLGPKTREFARATWFDTLDTFGARGVHVTLDQGTHFIDHYCVFSPEGVAQNFILKRVKSPVGNDAKELFEKTLGGLKVKDDLISARVWIRGQIAAVRLNDLKRIRSLKSRLENM